MSKVWKLGIYEDPFNAIRELGKEVEGRVPDPSNPEKNYGEIEAGDILQFNLKKEDSEEVQDWGFEVTYNEHYETVEDMIKGEGDSIEEGIERVLPQVDSLKEAEELYHSFPGYESRIKENGIYAIGLGNKIDLD